MDIRDIETIKLEDYEYVDENGNKISPYTFVVFCRADSFKLGMNNDYIGNFSSSPELACRNRDITSMPKQKLVRYSDMGPCVFGHVIYMVERI